MANKQTFYFCFNIILLIFVSASVAAVNPCENTDGSLRTELDLDFTESYGDQPRLSTVEETRRVSQIQGCVRHQSSSSKLVNDSTIVLRPFDNPGENRFHNGSDFMPLELYFSWIVEHGYMSFRLKRAIDREILDIFDPQTPGVTRHGAFIRFHIECRPDSADFSARNFTVIVTVNDVNDNAPMFYNASDSTNDSINTLTIVVREGTPGGVVIFSGIAARDKDDGANARVVAAMDQLSRSPFFKLAGNHSEIHLITKRAVHYEYLGKRAGVQINLVIVAEDSHPNVSMRLSSRIKIHIIIADEEDPAPDFEVPGCLEYSSKCINPTYFATAAVKSEAQLLTNESLVIKPAPIRVRKQPGFYGIRYGILDSEYSSYFKIHQLNGKVSQIKPIDNGTASITLVIKAIKWTDKVDPYLGRVGLALLIIGTDQKTTQKNQYGPWSKPAVCILSTALVTLLLTSGAAMAIFHCFCLKKTEDSKPDPCEPQQQNAEPGEPAPDPAGEHDNNELTNKIRSPELGLGGASNAFQDAMIINNADVSIDNRRFDKHSSYSPESTGNSLLDESV